MAIVAVAATYLVGAAFGAVRSSVTLVLAGVAVTSLATAIQAFMLQRHTDVIKVVYSWILGRFTGSTWSDVRLVLPYIVVTIARADRPPPAPRRAARRRRRGRLAGHRRAPAAARRRDRGDARHGRGGQRQRADRLRRHRRAALHPPDRGRVVPPAAAAQRAVRRGVHDPLRPHRPHRAGPGGGADRRGHGVHRRAVLHRRAAQAGVRHHERSGARSSVQNRSVSRRTRPARSAASSNELDAGCRDDELARLRRGARCATGGGRP